MHPYLLRSYLACGSCKNSQKAKELAQVSANSPRQLENKRRQWQSGVAL